MHTHHTAIRMHSDPLEHMRPGLHQISVSISLVKTQSILMRRWHRATQGHSASSSHSLLLIKLFWIKRDDLLYLSARTWKVDSDSSHKWMNLVQLLSAGNASDQIIVCGYLLLVWIRGGWSLQRLMGHISLWHHSANANLWIAMTNCTIMVLLPLHM